MNSLRFKMKVASATHPGSLLFRDNPTKIPILRFPIVLEHYGTGLQIYVSTSLWPGLVRDAYFCHFPCLLCSAPRQTLLKFLESGKGNRFTLFHLYHEDVVLWYPRPIWRESAIKLLFLGKPWALGYTFSWYMRLIVPSQHASFQYYY